MDADLIFFCKKVKNILVDGGVDGEGKSLALALQYILLM